MYEVLSETPKDIFMTYLIIFSACIVSYSIVLAIVRAVTRGRSRWR